MQDAVPASQILDFFREGFEHTAWRLETRRGYAADQETDEYEQFLNGIVPPRDEDGPWFVNARDRTAQGKRIERVRLVDEPATGNQRYLLATTPDNLAAGEDIRYMLRSVAEQLKLPRFDFWLFDSRVAVGDVAELFDVDVYEFAGPVAFVAAYDAAGGTVQVGQAGQVVADQDPGSLGDGDVLQAVVAERRLPSDDETNTDGNRHFYGFECENLGDGKDPWPDVQLEAIEKVSAAICRHHGWGSRSVIGHKEWAVTGALGTNPRKATATAGRTSRRS